MSPNPIDIQLGLNLRIQRKKAGLSQERLGELCGISFQQVQKYENALNRISVSRLVEFARHIRCSVVDLFDGIVPIASELEKRVSEAKATKERLTELAEAFAIELGCTLRKVEGRNG